MIDKPRALAIAEQLHVAEAAAQGTPAEAPIAKLHKMLYVAAKRSDEFSPTEMRTMSGGDDKDGDDD